VIDLTWKIFSQTGNIETYLLMKELENDYMNKQKTSHKNMTHEVAYKER